MSDRNTLTGMLIGLARATFGNNDIITPNTYPVIIRRLCAGDDEIDAMIEAVHREKYTIVPDCAVCTVKCGRNEDFDMMQLGNEPEAEKNLKLQLIQTAADIAACVKDRAEYDKGINAYFTKALMMAGTADLPADFLQPAVEEGIQLLQQLKI